MNRTHLRGAILILAMGALSGCSDLRKAIGLEKVHPDEFEVVSGAPLALPPDFGLRPPRSPSEKITEGTETDKARQTVFREANAPAVQPAAAPTGVNGALTPGEQALLTHAGALNADSSVRDQVDKEANLANHREVSFVDSLLFWQDNSPPPPDTVDASAESQRLRENAALGKPVNSGEAPKIEREKRTLLEGLF